MPYFISAVLTLPLIPSVAPSPSTKKLFFGLSKWHDELLSTAKIITFLVVMNYKIPGTFSTKCYSLTIIGKFTFVCISC